MSQLPDEWRNARTVGFFLKHLVPIYLQLRKEDECRNCILSAFVLSVKDRWFIMTAGHGLTRIAKLRAQGFEIFTSTLLDNIAHDAPFKHPVTFNYDDAKPTVPGSDPMFDYGILFPTDNTRELLTRGGVKAFSEPFWDVEFEEFKEYKLLGIPEQWVKQTSELRADTTAFLIRVDRLPDRGDFPETDAPMFYGKLPGDPGTSLHGMSGGPIIGAKTIDGRLHYFLVAMQVSSMAGVYLSGMLMRPFARLLLEIANTRASSSRP